MKARNYVVLCVAVAVVTTASILFIPGLADAIETSLLVFLMTNARA
jgi:hypothetical protein